MTTNTTLIIPRTKSPQGLIASAKTFRLVLDDEGLWVIWIGRAMGMKVKSGDQLADALAGKIANRIEARNEERLAETESQIADIPLNKLAQRKHSFQVPLAEQGVVKFSQRTGQNPRLIIKSRAGKLKLEGNPEDAESLARIAEAFA